MKEKLIKSKERVAAHGEVFTPSWVVRDMCDMLPADAFMPDKTFLEPACGTGNFLVEIVRRKLENGATYEQAAETVFGIDIQADNVHECIDRLEKMLPGTRPILERNIVCGNFLTKLTNTGEKIWFLDDVEEEQICFWK